MGKVKSSQKSRKRKRVLANDIQFSKVAGIHPGFLIWRDHCGRQGSCHLKGSPPTPATTGEKQESWGHMGIMLAIAQAGECLVSQGPFSCWKPLQGERRKSEAHNNMSMYYLQQQLPTSPESRCQRAIHCKK